MLNVMLVDDEQMALEGLKLLIDWQREGFNVCASCRSAEEAMSELQRRKPDLVVTDLAMPETDGIEMIKAMRQKGFDGCFIIVSGYADFEKARSAMNIGVCGYILKPIDTAEASEAVQRARTELIKREMHGRSAAHDVYSALSALISGAEGDATAIDGRLKLITWGAPLSGGQSISLQRLLSAEGVKVTAHMAEGWEWLVIRGDISEAALDTLRLQTEALGRELHISDDISADELRQCCLNMRAASHNDVELLELCAALTDAISVRDADKAQALSNRLEALCRSLGQSARRRVNTLMRTGCGQQLLDEPKRLDEFLSFKGDNISDIAMLAIKLLAPRSGRVSDAVKEYCGKHYMSQGLKLEQVAAELGYNATYLSRAFREETGSNFRDWLNVLRVEKAASMLEATQLSVCEIAEAVGYGQYKLLLMHFKRHYGVTPDKYRKYVNP